MISVRINEIDYSIKQKVNEFTIGEFETITTILNNSELDKIDKYTQIFTVLGVPQNVIDEMETSHFFNLVKEFANIEDNIDYLVAEKVKEVTVNGRVYQAYEGDEFKMNVKQMKMIEKYIKLNPKTYISDLMAIIFKDVQLTNNEHYVDAHIKHKSNLFKDAITVDVALPYVGFFSKELLTNLQTYASL